MPSRLFSHLKTPRSSCSSLRHAVVVWLVLVCAVCTQAAASDLEVELRGVIGGAGVLPGDQRRVEAIVTNAGAEQLGRITITVEAMGGDVGSPQGDGIRWRSRGDAWEGRVRRLDAGASLQVPLDVNFNPVGLSASDEMVSGRLTVSAETRDGAARAEASDSWTMRNCGGRYHAALQTISEDGLSVLKEAVAGAQTAWRRLNGNWVFRPGRVRGDELFAHVIKQATRIVRARGVDRRLRQALKERTMGRLTTDLRLYTRQRETPAICTGSQQYMDFFESQFGTFADRIKTMTALYEQAGQMADWKLLAAGNALSDISQSGTLDARGTERAEALGGVLAQARDLWRNVLDADGTRKLLLDNVLALREFASTLRGLNIKRGDALNEARDTLTLALSAVEAFAYVQGVHANHQSIATGFYGTVSSIRTAHDETCLCTP